MRCSCPAAKARRSARSRSANGRARVARSRDAVSLGDPTRPEAFRLFVGGAGAVVATAGAQQWNGLVYAPQADVRFAGITAVNGSIFAKTLAWDGVLDVAYPGWTSTPGASCSASQPDPLR